jgi:pimeloyl-ACP methyl ester carboxylesterase
VNDGIEGTWNGVIDLNGTPVPIVLHLAVRDSKLRATADFPKHYRSGIDLLDVSFAERTLRFATRNMGVFTGSLSGDGAQIAGAFSNKDQRYPLVLGTGDIQRDEPARPQTPKPPFGYDSEEVYVDRTGCRLAGTFTIPSDRKIRAGVLLITGSGAMDRDETVFGHKPFWILADYLSRHGYAVLRLDNRGVGASTGDRSTHTIADDVADMSAALDRLKVHDDLRGAPIGLVGHSVGGLTGAMIAAQRSDVAFLVSMAGPGLSVGETFADRECDGLEKANTDAAAIERHRAFTLALYQSLRDRDDAPIDSDEITTLAARCGATETAVVKNSADWIARFNEPWFRSLVRCEPTPIVGRVTAPFLAINGSLDAQVRAATNLAAMKRALEIAGHPDFQIVELAGLNHLFQTCTTGLPYEYPAIEETFAQRALQMISDWLDARFSVQVLSGPWQART